MMNIPETRDMITCLEEICIVFTLPSSEEVVRMVTEDLRHLDTAVVLGLVKARSDFNTFTGRNQHWAKLLRLVD
jgi:hypothetical protein